MSEAITLRYTVPGDDFTRAGEASADVKRNLKRMGVDREAVRKAEKESWPHTQKKRQY